jgi:hypothetical protein
VSLCPCVRGKVLKKEGAEARTPTRPVLAVRKFDGNDGFRVQLILDRSADHTKWKSQAARPI